MIKKGNMEGVLVTEIEESRPLARRKKSKPHNGIPKAAFRRLVNEVCEENRCQGTLWTKRAMAALQESCECMLERRFHRAQRLANLCNVSTLSQEHWEEADPKHSII